MPPTPPNRLAALLARAGLDWFVLGLAGAVGLAYLGPGVGSKASPLPWAVVIKVGIGVIFFFYGLKLSPDQLRAGMRNWRLHGLIQLTTFGLFPGLALLVRPGFAAGSGPLLWSSIFFLCALPSTVSTSVVMVSLARGNIPAAIFNATLSGLLGIGLTPLWTGLVLHTGAAGLPLGRLVLDLLVQVVLPVAAGVLLNARLEAWAAAHRAQLRVSDQVIILVIVFTAFCESFATGVFRSYGPAEVVGLAAGMAGLYLLVCGLTWGLSRLLGFGPADRATALFCGSKKSLVHGSVFASLLFPGAATGALLLPLMLYHALQIVLASLMARRFRKTIKNQELKIKILL